MLPILSHLHAILRLITGALFLLLMGAVMIQVTTRLMLPNPPVWTEEFSRFCLIMITALGAGLALRSGELVGVDLITGMFAPSGRRIAEIGGLLLVILFCIALVPPGIDFVDIGSIQTSPALDWNMFWMHLAVVIAPATLALASVERIIALVLGAGKAV